jgi:hypothetical protein
MAWMDTPAGPIELLIGLDNSQWLPVFLEDSKEPAVNMRLMKSSFGHMYMVMGSRGTALYPRDESMRYRGDPTGERLTHAEMEQKVWLERCFGGRSQPGPKRGGRIPIKGPAPVLGRVASDYGPVGSRRPPPARTVVSPPAPPRGAAPPPIRMPFSLPPASPPRARVGEGEGGEDVGESSAHGNHRGRCFFSPWGCQVCCSHQDPRIRYRGWLS